MRGSKKLLAPVYDTVKQFEKANAKADTIMSTLDSIKLILGIEDTAKCPKK